MWRWKYRRGLALRQPYGRAGQRRRRPGAGMLRSWVHPSHRNRRQPGAGTCKYTDCRWATHAGRRCRRTSDQRCNRVSTGPGHSHGRQRHPENRQQRDGRRNSQHQCGTGPRPPGLRAGGLWRRRSHARYRRGKPIGNREGRDSTAPRDCVRLRIAGRRIQKRLRQNLPATVS